MHELAREILVLWLQTWRDYKLGRSQGRVTWT